MLNRCVDTPFFSGSFVQKIVIFCFMNSFVQEKFQQSHGSCNVTSETPFSFKLFKTVILFRQSHLKNTF